MQLQVTQLMKDVIRKYSTIHYRSSTTYKRRYRINMPLCASTGTVLGRRWQHRPSTGLVLAHNGMFMGPLPVIIYCCSDLQALYRCPSIDYSDRSECLMKIQHFLILDIDNPFSVNVIPRKGDDESEAGAAHRASVRSRASPHHTEPHGLKLTQKKYQFNIKRSDWD